MVKSIIYDLLFDSSCEIKDKFIEFEKKFENNGYYYFNKFKLYFDTSLVEMDYNIISYMVEYICLTTNIWGILKDNMIILPTFLNSSEHCPSWYYDKDDFEVYKSQKECYRILRGIYWLIFTRRYRLTIQDKKYLIKKIWSQRFFEYETKQKIISEYIYKFYNMILFFDKHAPRYIEKVHNFNYNSYIDRLELFKQYLQCGMESTKYEIYELCLEFEHHYESGRYIYYNNLSKDGNFRNEYNNASISASLIPKFLINYIDSWDGVYKSKEECDRILRGLFWLSNNRAIGLWDDKMDEVRNYIKNTNLPDYLSIFYYTLIFIGKNGKNYSGYGYNGLDEHLIFKDIIEEGHEKEKSLDGMINYVINFCNYEFEDIFYTDINIQSNKTIDIILNSDYTKKTQYNLNRILRGIYYFIYKRGLKYIISDDNIKIIKQRHDTNPRISYWR